MATIRRRGVSHATAFIHNNLSININFLFLIELNDMCAAQKQHRRRRRRHQSIFISCELTANTYCAPLNLLIIIIKIGCSSPAFNYREIVFLHLEYFAFCVVIKRMSKQCSQHRFAIYSFVHGERAMHGSHHFRLQ